MDSTTADDTLEKSPPPPVTENGTTSAQDKPSENGHTKNHSRQNSIGYSCNQETLSQDKPGSEKSQTGAGAAYEKLKGLFRNKSSTGSKSNSSPQIKVSMHPEGEDKKMSQKSSKSTKLTLDAHEADGESDTDFEVPNDGNLYTYSVDNMMQFFKYMNFDDKIVKSLQRRKVDGRRFSKMTDEDLKKYGIDNPIVVYFRGKSEKKRESAHMFML